MATRSTIAIENQDGSVQSIYCHWDGYPEHNGKILQEDYTNREKVEALIALGSISVLAPEPSIPEGASHNFESPYGEIVTYGGIVIAYHRDRAEPLSISQHKSAESFLRSDVEEYGYLFTKDGQWLMVNGYKNDRTRDFIELKEILQNS